ncbi:L-threonylcarbamoyladenylate synthase [Gemmatimonadota bacterium]
MPEAGPEDHDKDLTLPPDETGLRRAVEALRSGGIVAYPTETQYGLGVDALNPASTRSLHELKERGEGTFLVVTADEAAARELCSDFPDPARSIARNCWPGPVTILVPARDGLPAEVVGEGGLLGVRVSGNPIARELPARLGGPVVSTSANLTGRAPLNDPGLINRVFPDRLDLILDGGVLPPGPGSTIVDGRTVPLKVIREGAVSRNSLARRTRLEVEGGQALPLILTVCTGNTCRSPMAEGALKVMLRQRGLEDEFDVQSAGVAAVNWGMATEETQAAAWEQGIDLSTHKPRQLSQQMTQEADIILVMSERHRNRVAVIDPHVRDRIHIIRKLSAELHGKSVAGRREIRDPYGSPPAAYRKVLKMIWNDLEKGFEGTLQRARDHRASLGESYPGADYSEEVRS